MPPPGDECAASLPEERIVRLGDDIREVSWGMRGLRLKAGPARHDHPRAPQTNGHNKEPLASQGVCPAGPALPRLMVIRAALPPLSVLIVWLGCSCSLRVSSMCSRPWCVGCAFPRSAGLWARAATSCEPYRCPTRRHQAAPPPPGDSTPHRRATMAQARPHLRFPNEREATMAGYHNWAAFKLVKFPCGDHPPKGASNLVWMLRTASPARQSRSTRRRLRSTPSGIRAPKTPWVQWWSPKRSTSS